MTRRSPCLVPLEGTLVFPSLSKFHKKLLHFQVEVYHFSLIVDKAKRKKIVSTIKFKITNIDKRKIEERNLKKSGN